MKGVGLDTVVRLLDSGVGIVDQPQADFLVGEADTDAEAVFELEGRA